MLVVGATASFLSTKAFAADTSKAAQATELFKKSVDAYRAGQLANAVELLNQAYALDPQPVLLYNLARAYEGLGDNANAVTTYEKYLHDDPKAKDRGAIEQRVETLKREIAEKTALAQQRDAERQRAEDLKKEKERSTATTAAAAAPPPTSPEPERRSVLPYVVMGVGAAGAATGVVFGLMATSTHSEAQSARSQETAIATLDEAKSQATISTIALIAGGALIAAGAVWWILDTPKSKKVGVAVGPSSLMLRGAF